MPTTASTRIFASVAASSDPLPPSLPHLRHHLALRKCLPPEASASSEPRFPASRAATSITGAAQSGRACGGGPPGLCARRFDRSFSAATLAATSAVCGIHTCRHFTTAGSVFSDGKTFFERELASSPRKREREIVRKRDRKKRRNNQSCTRAAHNACKSSSLAQVHLREFSHLVL